MARYQGKISVSLSFLSISGLILRLIGLYAIPVAVILFWLRKHPETSTLGLIFFSLLMAALAVGLWLAGNFLMAFSSAIRGDPKRLFWLVGLFVKIFMRKRYPLLTSLARNELLIIHGQLNQVGDFYEAHKPEEFSPAVRLHFLAGRAHWLADKDRITEAAALMNGVPSGEGETTLEPLIGIARAKIALGQSDPHTAEGEINAVLHLARSFHPLAIQALYVRGMARELQKKHEAALLDFREASSGPEDSEYTLRARRRVEELSAG
ncbi:MAG: hypothetical protein GMKNLPBB_03221 [Myxococcota bacterium]|nr:hypothetical protein [Myxococcota bacterium]